MPLQGVSGVGHSFYPNCLSFGQAAGDHCPFSVGTRDVGVETCHLPHSTRLCDLALRAVGAALKRQVESPLASMRGVRGRALFLPDRPSLKRAAGARYPLTEGAACGCGGPHSPLCACRYWRYALSWPRFSWAPSPVPWFSAWCARFPGLRPLLAVATWHLSWPRVGAPCLVRSAGSRCSGRLSYRRGAFPYWGILPANLLGRCVGYPEGVLEPGSWCLPLAPAEAVAPGCNVSFLFGAPLWVFSLVGASGVGLGLRALRCLGVCAPGHSHISFSTGDSAGAPGLFLVNAGTSPLGSEDAMPGSSACARVRALLGMVRPAGLLDRFWCASPFLCPFCPFSLLRLRPHNHHQHTHIIHLLHHHVLIQHATPQTARGTSQKGPQARRHREQPHSRQGTRPDEARARSPAETQDRRHAAAQTHRGAATATRSQTQAKAQAQRHDSSASPTPRGRPL